MHANLGPLPEPFMELHREISPHVYAAWAEQMRAYAAQQVAAERERCLADCEAVGDLGAALVAQRIRDRA